MIDVEAPHALEEVLTAFETFGDVTVKTVFGAWGFFQKGVMFALLSEGQLYLRGSVRLRGAFCSLNMEKFYCARKGKSLELHYYRVGAHLWQDRALLLKYAKKVLQCAAADRQLEAKEQSARYGAIVRKHFFLPEPRSYVCIKEKSELSC